MTPKRVTIGWDSPSTEDGSTVTQYLIEMKEEGQAGYTPIGRVDGTVHSYDADFLSKDRRYSFKVRAKNAAGVSEPPAETEQVQLKKAGEHKMSLEK